MAGCDDYMFGVHIQLILIQSLSHWTSYKVAISQAIVSYFFKRLVVHLKSKNIFNSLLQNVYWGFTSKL